jgi:ribonucleoside-diphosphate reductase alpha chain
MLILLQIPYDSEQAIDLAHQLMQFIQNKSFHASMELAGERDNFPNWNKSVFYPHTQMRNATRLSIAPTGTIAILANTSSSIEPLFALAYERQHVLDGQLLPEVNEHLVDYLKQYGFFSTALLDEVKKTGSVQYLLSLPPEVKRLFRTALEISPDWHLKHQLAFQQYVDNAVSKTINLPGKATVKDIDLIYRTAWKQKAKGITVYRNRSKREQVLQVGITVANAACKACVR